jgi:hypothetical protein
MRPLNRPMFRYGGPIKEGIMKGMKEPQAVNTVGSPLAPKDETGRGGYALPLIPLAFQAARFALKPLGTLAMRQALKSGLIRGTGAGTVRGGLGTSRALTPADMTTKLSFNPNKLGQYFLGSPEGKFLTGQGGKISKFAKKAVTGTLRSPTATLLTAGTLTDILPGGKPFGPDKYLPNILGQRFDEQGNKIPGTGFFNPDKVEKGETEGMKRVETIGAGEGSTGGGVTDDPDKKRKIDNDRIEATKKRYYELMGIDKMKKDAAYDSLIDASKIVQQEGTDLKGAIKSGNLQTQIINAISKNLDKSADIKRQIDAAILKGEIQKDVASADSVDKDLKKARIKQLERAEKNASASGQIAAVRSEKGFVPGATTAAILRNDGIKYDTILQDKLITDFKEDNPTKDEVDYIISLGTELPDGRYVVGERLVEKKGNEVAFIV